MFTGIIESTGKTVSIRKIDQGLSFDVSPTKKDSFKDVVLGESIAINGVCLTVEKIAQTPSTSFQFFASSETLQRSNLGNIDSGTVLNLERAMLAGGRFSGHIVQGHVDGVAKLIQTTPVGEAFELKVELSPELSKYVIEKGSITLDGISLTVNSISKNVISLMIIPHTWAHTNLSSIAAGHRFNVEVDVIAKYVESLTNAQRKDR